MFRIRRLFRRFQSLFRRDRIEGDLAEELQFHLDKEIQKNIEAGMNTQAARYAALRILGGAEQVKEECRDMTRARWLEALGQDLRYGLRMFWKSPGFAVVAMLIMSLGIGANTVIFTVVNALLLRSLPVERPEELVLLKAVRLGGDREEFMYPEYEALRDNSGGLANLLASSGMQYSVLMRTKQAERSESMNLTFVSGNYFAVLKVQAALGRTFTKQDDLVSGSGGPDGIWP